MGTASGAGVCLENSLGVGVVRRKNWRCEMEICPFGDWVVIEPEVVKQTPGGIFVPSDALEDPNFMSKTGTVVAVGPGPLLETGERPRCQSSVGDRVEFLSNVAKRVKQGEKELYVVRDGNVIFRMVG